MNIRFSSRSKCALLLVGVLFFAGCDSLLTGFRAGFAASKPVVQSFVTSGVLTQAQADAAIRDVDDSIRVLENGDRCLKAITSTGHAKQAAKAKCYYDAAQAIRPILARHNLAGSPILDQIATIASAAIEAFEQFYTEVNTPADITGSTGGITQTGADGIKDGDAEKQLEVTMKELKKQLDALKQK